MKPTSLTEVHPSPALEVRAEPSPARDGPVAATRQVSRPAAATATPPAAATATPPAARRTPLARLLAGLRGDKYMVDAYPPTESLSKEG